MKKLLSIFLVLLVTISATVLTASAASDDLKYYLGDVDADNDVTIKDATRIQKHLAGLITLSEDRLVLADYNEDGRVSIKDATAIQKFIALIEENVIPEITMESYTETFDTLVDLIKTEGGGDSITLYYDEDEEGYVYCIYMSCNSDGSEITITYHEGDDYSYGFSKFYLNKNSLAFCDYMFVCTFDGTETVAAIQDLNLLKPDVSRDFVVDDMDFFRNDTAIPDETISQLASITSTALLSNFNSYLSDYIDGITLFDLGFVAIPNTTNEAYEEAFDTLVSAIETYGMDGSCLYLDENYSISATYDPEDSLIFIDYMKNTSDLSGLGTICISRDDAVTFEYSLYVNPNNHSIIGYAYYPDYNKAAVDSDFTLEDCADFINEIGVTDSYIIELANEYYDDMTYLFNKYIVTYVPDFSLADLGFASSNDDIIIEPDHGITKDAYEEAFDNFASIIETYKSDGGYLLLESDGSLTATYDPEASKIYIDFLVSADDIASLSTICISRDKVDTFDYSFMVSPDYFVTNGSTYYPDYKKADVKSDFTIEGCEEFINTVGVADDEIFALANVYYDYMTDMFNQRIVTYIPEFSLKDLGFSE